MQENTFHLTNNEPNPVSGNDKNNQYNYHYINKYPKSLKICQIANSQFWQIKLRIGGHVFTKSAKTSDLETAKSKAILFFNELIGIKFLPKESSPPSNSNSDLKFEKVALRAIEFEKIRHLIGEISKGTFNNFKYRTTGCLIPIFGERNISDINQKDIHHLLTTLNERELGSISISQHFQYLKKILQYALENELIFRIPNFPKIRKQFIPRGGFSINEYLQLTRAAQKLSNISNPNLKITHRNNAN